MPTKQIALIAALLSSTTAFAAGQVAELSFGTNSVFTLQAEKLAYSLCPGAVRELLLDKSFEDKNLSVTWISQDFPTGHPENKYIISGLQMKLEWPAHQLIVQEYYGKNNIEYPDPANNECSLIRKK